MSNFINNTQGNFTVIQNDLLNRKDISFEIKGLYCFLISKPSGWSFSAEKISYQTKEGVSSIKRMLKELEDIGLLKRHKIKNDSGVFSGVHYEIFSTMVAFSADGETADRFSVDGKHDNISNTINSNTINSNKEINNNSDFFEEEEKPKPKYTNRHFKNDLIEYGFNPDLVDEWMQVRKTKGATNSKTAFNRFIKQVELNGNNKNFILETCVAKSWSGFEADYNLGNVPNKVIAPNNQVSKQIDPLEYFGYELNPDYNVR